MNLFNLGIFFPLTILHFFLFILNFWIKKKRKWVKRPKFVIVASLDEPISQWCHTIVEKPWWASATSPTLIWRRILLELAMIDDNKNGFWKPDWNPLKFHQFLTTQSNWLGSRLLDLLASALAQRICVNCHRWWKIFDKTDRKQKKKEIKIQQNPTMSGTEHRAPILDL